MSFSSELRGELCKRIDRGTHCRIAELAGIIVLDGKLKELDGKAALSIRMEKDEVVETAEKLLQMLFGIEQEALDILPRKQGGARVRIRREEDLERIFETCKLRTVDDDSGVRLPEVSMGMDLRLDTEDIVLSKSCCRNAFLRGTYLAAGSVSDPKSQYQFEIVTDRDSVTRQVLTAMNGFGISGHVTERKFSQVVYIKEAGAISEILGQLGAANSMMEFENVRILKEIRNHVNREVNCDTANMTKVANASVKQIAEIRKIEETIGLSSLPDGLEELARLRLLNPDLSLKELGELLTTPLGKSGVNHRLRKLSEISRRLPGDEDA